jgi:hypothetical protein
MPGVQPEATAWCQRTTKNRPVVSRFAPLIALIQADHQISGEADESLYTYR